MPEYGTRTESRPISADPVRAMLQEGSPGALPTPVAFQLIVDPLSVPAALPESFRSPGHEALNDPLALVPVCSVTFHLKSVHELGLGIRLLEDQLPISAPMPAAEGPVTVLFLSNPIQAALAAARARQTAS